MIDEALQERCLALGVDLVFETDVTDDQALAAQYNADLVIETTSNTTLTFKLKGSDGVVRTGTLTLA